jgi:hypothetical protein
MIGLIFFTAHDSLPAPVYAIIRYAKIDAIAFRCALYQVITDIFTLALAADQAQITHPLHPGMIQVSGELRMLCDGIVP